MINKKWFAINIMAPQDASGKENLLVKMHAELISFFKTRLENWHFLWEGAPFTHTLLLRFYGDPDVIEELEKAMTGLLEKNYLRGAPDKKYPGEASIYGTEGGKYIAKVLHLGSEFAIAIIENERRGMENEEFKWTLSGYLERWTHLFMDQLNTRVAEAHTLFQLSVHRKAVNVLGEKEYRRISKSLDEKVAKELIPQFFEQTVLPLLTKLKEQ